LQTKIVDNLKIGIGQSTKVSGSEQYSPSYGFSVDIFVTTQIPEVLLPLKINTSEGLPWRGIISRASVDQKRCEKENQEDSVVYVFGAHGGFPLRLKHSLFSTLHVTSVFINNKLAILSRRYSASS
jgi:hypothetical protein